MCRGRSDARAKTDYAKNRSGLKIAGQMRESDKAKGEVLSENTNKSKS